jgi:hypothetical protein
VTIAAARFADDLRNAGAGSFETARVSELYDRALHERSERQWRRFYRATFFALHRLAREGRAHSARAAEPLLRLLEDDLGSTLFGTEAVAQLRSILTKNCATAS